MNYESQEHYEAEMGYAGQAKAFNLKVVPVIIEGTIQEAVDYVKTKPNSIIAEELKESEGLVGTPVCRLNDLRGNRIIVKVKVCDFI